MADKAGGAVVLAQLQVAFLVVWSFSCLQNLVADWGQDVDHGVSSSLNNSAGALSTADFPICSVLTAASTSSRRIGRASSSGICGQSSTDESLSVS